MIIKSIMQDIKDMWGNGTKILLAGFLFMLSACVFFAAISLYAFVSLKDSPKFNPIHNENPQQVLDFTVPQGGSVRVVATKCVVSEEAINVQVQSWWQNMDDRTKRIERTPIHSSIREPGCDTTTFANPIPSDLPPAHYQIQASEIVRSNDGKSQITGWHTQTFEVTRAEETP